MTTQPVTAVGAIVLDKGALLLVKRDREPAKGQWSLPGGRVETGETLREALQREVREETGIDIEVDGLIGVAERIVRDDDGEISYHYVILDYVCAPRSHELTAGDDASEARWVPVGELADLHLTAGLLEFLADRGVLDGRRIRVDRGA
ncbi:MAG TPA: NUDIX hydrolase [Actinomycetota bacterium]|nr:NUDIX hydrolase [Actinomycetota bacterium]